MSTTVNASARSPFELYSPTLRWGLVTDTYSFTMPQAWIQKGWQHRQAVFYGFFRKLPAECGYAVFGGAEFYADLLRRVVYDQPTLNWMATLKTDSGHRYFGDRFLRHLEGRRLSVSIDAPPSGTIVFPHEPIIRGRGPLWELALIEGGLLNVINTYSGGMSQAARIVDATGFQLVADNSLRRGKGVMGATEAALAAYMGGISKTSNMLAVSEFGIPPSGTMAHCFVTSFDTEDEAFLAFAEANQGNCVFLVDTYNTVRGVEAAIRVALAMRERKLRLDGIRLDSGDLGGLSRMAREKLDAAGLTHVAITGSNSLTAKTIRSLKGQDAKITVWATGDAIAASPLFGAVWKLCAVEGKAGSLNAKLKVGEESVKSSVQGDIDVVRCFDAQGAPMGDFIYDQTIDTPNGQLMIDPSDVVREYSLRGAARREQLLQPIVQRGEMLRGITPHSVVRERTLANIRALGPQYRRLENPHRYAVGLARGLAERRMELIRTLKSDA